MGDHIQLASPLQYDSIVDGPGIRMVVWTQGCLHHCLHCHNPQTWDPDGGQSYAVDTLVQEIEEAQLQTGITFSGGEPFLQAKQLLPLAQAAKKKNLNIWAYSGYQFEDLLLEESKKTLLTYIDVLVDGKFINEQKDYRLMFKGSRNQRMIDVQKSLSTGQIVLSSFDDKNNSLTIGE